MRVLMVSKALVVASYRSKLTELGRLGAEVIAVAPPAWIEEGRAIPFEAGNTDAFEIIQAPMAWNGHYHLHYYPSLSRIVKQTQPDILHVDEEPYNLATYLAFRDAGSVGARALFFTWQNIHRTYPPPFRMMERFVYRHAGYALAGSQTAGEIVAQKGFEGPVAVIPQFGVDTDQFAPTQPARRPFTAGFLGRLVPEKGIADLMSAFQRMDPPSRLIVAGDGPLAPFVESAGMDLKRHNRLERYPRVPSADVPGLLHRMDALVLPSRTTRRWREQYGRILIEAMASGLPVVGSDSGEISNIVGDAGIVFPEGNVDKLAEALIQLAESPERRREIGRRGRERAVKLFSQKEVATRTYAVYEQMMDGARSAWESPKTPSR